MTVGSSSYSEHLNFMVFFHQMHHEIINIVEKNVTLAPMFTYIDPKVRKRLIDKKKLICIDSDGNPTDINS